MLSVNLPEFVRSNKTFLLTYMKRDPNDLFENSLKKYITYSLKIFIKRHHGTVGKAQPVESEQSFGS